MVPDTIIKQDPRQRRIGGAFLLLIGLPLTLIAARVWMIITPDLLDVAIMASGPLLIALGVWAIVSSQDRKVRLRITDDAVIIPGKANSVILLDRLDRVTLSRPLMSKHDVLTFEAGGEKALFDVIHLKVSARDIVSMVSARMENRDVYLHELMGEVSGLPTGVWVTRQGTKFA
ncbi:MAG: hypothetical protein AAGF56_01320 [Pseudomonadota bacterium]